MVMTSNDVAQERFTAVLNDIKMISPSILEYVEDKYRYPSFYTYFNHVLVEKAIEEECIEPDIVEWAICTGFELLIPRFSRFFNAAQFQDLFFHSCFIKPNGEKQTVYEVIEKAKFPISVKAGFTNESHTLNCSPEVVLVFYSELPTNVSVSCKVEVSVTDGPNIESEWSAKCVLEPKRNREIHFNLVNFNLANNLEIKSVIIRIKRTTIRIKATKWKHEKSLILPDCPQCQISIDGPPHALFGFTYPITLTCENKSHFPAYFQFSVNGVMKIPVSIPSEETVQRKEFVRVEPKYEVIGNLSVSGVLINTITQTLTPQNNNPFIFHCSLVDEWATEVGLEAADKEKSLLIKLTNNKECNLVYTIKSFHVTFNGSVLFDKREPIVFQPGKSIECLKAVDSDFLKKLKVNGSPVKINGKVVVILEENTTEISLRASIE